jgi:hypothetical protein
MPAVIAGLRFVCLDPAPVQAGDEWDPDHQAGLVPQSGSGERFNAKFRSARQLLPGRLRCAPVAMGTVDVSRETISVHRDALSSTAGARPSLAWRTVPSALLLGFLLLLRVAAVCRRTVVLAIVPAELRVAAAFDACAGRPPGLSRPSASSPLCRLSRPLPPRLRLCGCPLPPRCAPVRAATCRRISTLSPRPDGRIAHPARLTDLSAVPRLRCNSAGLARNLRRVAGDSIALRCSKRDRHSGATPLTPQTR